MVVSAAGVPAGRRRSTRAFRPTAVTAITAAAAAALSQPTCSPSRRADQPSDDLFVAPVLQQIAVDVLTAPGWPRHLGSVRRALRERRDALAAAIGARLPGCTLDLIPAGGVHLWLRLPDDRFDADVADAALARGLAVSPGRASFPGEPPAPYLRMSYAATEGAGLVRAAAILADVLGG